MGCIAVQIFKQIGEQTISNLFIYSRSMIQLAYQSFDFDRTRCRLFQKRVVRTKFDIYIYI